MTKNYFTDEQLNAIHKEICRLEDLESGTSLPVHPLNNVETANLRRICNLAVEAAIGEAVAWMYDKKQWVSDGIPTYPNGNCTCEQCCGEVEKVITDFVTTDKDETEDDSVFNVRPLYSVKELEN